MTREEAGAASSEAAPSTVRCSRTDGETPAEANRSRLPENRRVASRQGVVTDETAARIRAILVEYDSARAVDLDDEPLEDIPVLSPREYALDEVGKWIDRMVKAENERSCQ